MWQKQHIYFCRQILPDASAESDSKASEWDTGWKAMETPSTKQMERAKSKDKTR